MDLGYYLKMRMMSVRISVRVDECNYDVVCVREHIETISIPFLAICAHHSRLYDSTYHGRYVADEHDRAR